MLLAGVLEIEISFSKESDTRNGGIYPIFGLEMYPAIAQTGQQHREEPPTAQLRHWKAPV